MLSNVSFLEMDGLIESDVGSFGKIAATKFQRLSVSTSIRTWKYSFWILRSFHPDWMYKWELMWEWQQQMEWPTCCAIKTQNCSISSSTTFYSMREKMVCNIFNPECKYKVEKYQLKEDDKVYTLVLILNSTAKQKWATIHLC